MGRNWRRCWRSISAREMVGCPHSESMANRWEQGNSLWIDRYQRTEAKQNVERGFALTFLIDIALGRGCCCRQTRRQQLSTRFRLYWPLLSHSKGRFHLPPLGPVPQHHAMPYNNFQSIWNCFLRSYLAPTKVKLMRALHLRTSILPG